MMMINNNNDYADENWKASESDEKIENFTSYTYIYTTYIYIQC